MSPGRRPSRLGAARRVPQGDGMKINFHHTHFFFFRAWRLSMMNFAVDLF
jgi:hypothetical protein